MRFRNRDDYQSRELMPPGRRLLYLNLGEEPPRKQGRPRRVETNLEPPNSSGLQARDRQTQENESTWSSNAAADNNQSTNSAQGTNCCWYPNYKNVYTMLCITMEVQMKIELYFSHTKYPDIYG